MSNFEVVRSEVDGWDVRRTGEAQALSNYATKELAEQAARKQQEAEDNGGGDAEAIDVRQNVFSKGPEEDLDAKKTFLGVSFVLIGVIVLIVVIALVVSLTSFGS